MHFLKPFVAALTITAIAGPALADAKIYSYHSKHNYCPAGLQPVTINGTICCGTPTESISYQQALRHPVAKKKRHVHKVSKAHTCAEGTKGCF